MRELDLAYHIHHPAPTSRTFPNGEVDDDGLLLLIPTKIRIFLQLMWLWTTVAIHGMWWWLCCTGNSPCRLISMNQIQSQEICRLPYNTSRMYFTTIILFHHHRFIALSTIRFDVELAVVSTYIIFVEENKEEDVVVVVKRKPTRGAFANSKKASAGSIVSYHYNRYRWSWSWQRYYYSSLYTYWWTW